MASLFAIRYAAHAIRQGGVIAYPTETVYGLGCDPLNADAVHELCRLKSRDIRKGLILLANDIELFSGLIHPLSREDSRLISQATDTPTSWIVPAHADTPYWLTGYRDTLVIRVTQHPEVSNLCNRLRHPLVSSSANPGGHKPALNVFEVHRYFHGQLDAVLASSYKSSGQPSVIRQLHGGNRLR